MELCDLRSSLQHQTELFENMTNSLSTHAALAENRITRFQSDFIQALTIITIFYLPPTLASSIFSMQSAVLPEIVSFKYYIITLISLVIFTVLVVGNLPIVMKFWSLLSNTGEFIKYVFRKAIDFILR